MHCAKYNDFVHSAAVGNKVIAFVYGVRVLLNNRVLLGVGIISYDISFSMCLCLNWQKNRCYRLVCLF